MADPENTERSVGKVRALNSILSRYEGDTAKTMGDDDARIRHIIPRKTAHYILKGVYGNTLHFHDELKADIGGAILRVADVIRTNISHEDTQRTLIDLFTSAFLYYQDHRELTSEEQETLQREIASQFTSGERTPIAILDALRDMKPLHDLHELAYILDVNQDDQAQIHFWTSTANDEELLQRVDVNPGAKRQEFLTYFRSQAERLLGTL